MTLSKERLKSILEYRKSAYFNSALKIQKDYQRCGFYHYYWFFDDSKPDFHALTFPIFTPRRLHPSVKDNV